MTNDDTIDALNDLIKTCKDGEYGFMTSAEHVTSTPLRQLLTARANDCRKAASELQALVLENGGTPEDGGSASGAMHRGWVAVKSTLAGYSDAAILNDCESAEDVAMERYRKALDQDLASSARMVIERQFEGVKRNHASIRMLRDQERAKAA